MSLNKLFRKWFSSPRAPIQRKRRLSLEHLEDRTLPAAVTLLGVPTWIAEGPAPNTNGQDENIAAEPGGGPNAVSGAIEAIAVNPGNNSQVFVGTVNGGIWRSNNFFAATTPWTPLTDQFPALEISALQFDPTDASNQTLVAGIGNTSNISTTLGPLTGLLKTTDGGNTWAQLGNTAVAGLQGESVSAVLPRGNTILVGVVSGPAPGLYRSIDGGTSFQPISGLNNLRNGAVYDVAGDPSNSSRAYVVVGGGTGGVFRTDNLGNTWSDVTNAAELSLLTNANFNNARLSVSAAAPNPVYLAIATNGQLGDLNAPASGVFRSPDQGATWATMDLPQTLDAPRSISSVSNTTPIVITTSANHGYATGDRVRISGAGGGANGDWTITVIANNQFRLTGSTAGGGAGAGGTARNIQGILHGRQAFPNLAITADPGNANLVYIAGDRQDFLGADSSIGANAFTARIFRGNFAVPPQGIGSVVTDATHQWTPLTHSGTGNNSAPHADGRALAIAAGTLLYAGDGGIFNENNPTTTTGRWFSDNGTTMQVTQFSNEISYDSNSNIIFGGAQDTGTPQQTAPGSGVYSDQTQGDGPFTAVDDLTTPGGNSHRYIGFSRVDYSNANVNLGTGINLIPSGGVAGFTNFGVLAVSTVAPPAGQSTRLVIANGTNAGVSGVFDSTNAGIAATTGAIVYTQVPTGAGWNGVNQTPFAFGGGIFAITVGGMLNGVANQNVIYAASGNRVFLRSTAGGTLTQTAGQPAGAGTIQDVATDPTNWQIAYVTDGSRVFQTTDAGVNWTDITGNLNDNLVHTITVANNGAGVSAVLVGETNGVFRMLSTAPGQWTKYGEDFPNSSVWGVVYSAADDVLVAGTSGRGAFELQNASNTLFTQGILEVCGDQDFPNEDDTFRLVRDPVNNLFLDVFVNNTSAVPDFTVPMALVNQINVFGAGGNDNLIVDSSNGLITVPNGIRYDGDHPCPDSSQIIFDGEGFYAGSTAGFGGFDRLTLTQTGGDTQTSDQLAPGATPGSGESIITGPDGTQTVFFQYLEPITDTVPATTFTLSSVPGLASLLDADNAINYTQGQILGPTAGRITVDNFEPIEFQNKTNLVIDAGAGSDTINLHYNSTANPTGLTGTITVDGGDPTGSDTLIVNGIDGVLDNLRYLPTAVGAGTVVNDTQPQPNVLFTGIEHLTEVVQQTDGDGVRIDGTAGNDAVEFFHGLTGDSGSFVGTMDQNNATGSGPFTATPMSFTGAFPLANDSDVNFFNPGGTDSFVFNGTGNDDNIVVGSGEAGGREFRNTLNGIVVSRVEVFNVASTLVRALGGNDTISVNLPAGPGNVPLRVEGGDSDAGGSDTLNFTGSGTIANLITVDLQAGTVTEATFAAVTSTGVELLNVNAASHNLTIQATTGDDVLSVTPTGTNAATAQLLSSSPAIDASPTVNGTNIGTLSVDLRAGSDQLIVNGNQNANTITVNGLSVTVDSNPPGAPLEVVNYVGAEDLHINALAGNDNIDVTPAANTTISVDGGDPIGNGNTPADKIILHPAGAFFLEPGSHKDEGGLASSGAQRVSWVHIEKVVVVGGGPGLTLGTNGDDDITIIARDQSYDPLADGVQDFTVSVNDGPDILYINNSVHLVDALAGDDDIVVREPAPNNAVWNVQLFIAGGTPAAPTGDQGDVLEVETPGAQTVVFTAHPAAIPVPLLPAGVTITPTTGGIDTAIVNDTTNTSAIAAAPFTFAIAGFFTYTSSPGGIEQIVYQGLAGNDPLTINGTTADDTATLNADGTGSFRSPLSPTFDFSGAGVVTFDGAAGFDTAIYNGTAHNDTIDSNQTSATTVTTAVNVLTHIATNVEAVGINSLAGDDLIHVRVVDALETSNPSASVRFDVDGGTPNASDRLLVQDDGVGDTTILRQGPDYRSGSVTVGAFNPVTYQNIERLDITPVDPVSGGVGIGGAGRIKVFHNDPFEYNDNRLNSGQLARVGESPTSPTIDPGALVTPFPVNGDEDWYEFRPAATGTFQVKILFDLLPTLADGRPGLPGNGDLNLDIYDANGVLITSGVPVSGGKGAIFAATNDPAFPQFNRIFVRVHGATPNSINSYDFDNISGLASGLPGVSNVDTEGPQVTNVQISNHTDYDLFAQKSANAGAGPTPLVSDITISFQDQPARAPGFMYSALDPQTAGAFGTYVLKGDHVGIIPISSIEVLNNVDAEGNFTPVTVGSVPIATVILHLGELLPDDRYTLIIHDNLTDPAGNKLDGESDVQEPTGFPSVPTTPANTGPAAPTFPSGDGHAGGDFLARFTVDSRPEIGVWAGTQVSLDINGDGVWDPQATDDATNTDLSFKLGIVSDHVFTGNFNAPGAGVDGGFDKIGAYGKINGKFRFLLDFNSDGIPDANIISTRQINGLPISGDFDTANPGDEVGLFDGKLWYLDSNGNNNIDFGDRVISSPIRGLPIVGDFDGDGQLDLATYQPDRNVFQFDLAFDGFGQVDRVAIVNTDAGLPGVREIPVATDLNQDGVTDLGLFVPTSQDPSGNLTASWYFFLSDPTTSTTVLDRAGSFLNNLPFMPAPLGTDIFYSFGNNFAIPLVGNFDPPATHPVASPQLTTNIIKKIATNVTLSANIALIGSGSSAGLVSRYSASGNMYWAGVVDRNDTFFVEIRRKINGVWKTLSSVQVTTGIGKVTFTTSGSTLKVSFNGKLISSVTDRLLVSGLYGTQGTKGTTIANFTAK